VEKKTVTVTIGDKVVEMTELSFADAISVDKYVPTDDNGQAITFAILRVYAVGAITSINGELQRPRADKLQWDRTAGYFTATEAFALAGEYNKAFEAKPKTVAEVAEAKNGLSDPA
jgi:hypothetical protein